MRLLPSNAPVLLYSLTMLASGGKRSGSMAWMYASLGMGSVVRYRAALSMSAITSLSVFCVVHKHSGMYSKLVPAACTMSGGVLFPGVISGRQSQKATMDAAVGTLVAKGLR